MKTDIKKFALIAGVALAAVAVANRVEPIKQIVYG